jgi:hypothetical protein
MDAFSYLSVFLSIILGLAITQALQGVRALILARGAVRLFSPSLIWTGIVILMGVQSWWASFGLVNVPSWSFLAFSMVIAQALCLYLLAALVLPDIAPGGGVDLEQHYFLQRRWFHGTLFAMLLFSVTKDWILSGHLPEPVNLGFHAFFGILSIVSLATRNRVWHLAVAPFVAAIIIVYIALLFARL